MRNWGTVKTTARLHSRWKTSGGQVTFQAVAQSAEHVVYTEMVNLMSAFEDMLLHLNVRNRQQQNRHSFERL